TGYGASANAYLYTGSQLQIEDCQFIQCKGSEINGGAIYLNINNKGQATISNSLFNQCESKFGGGIYVSIESGGKLTIQQQCNFTECKADTGGGISASVSGIGSKLILEDGVKFDTCIKGVGISSGGGAYFDINEYGECIIREVQFIDCSAFIGGGLFVSIINAQFSVNGTNLFQNCLSSSGGGIYSNIQEGQFSLTNTCKFFNCTSLYGGGICANINDGQYNIEGATFDRCICTQPGFGGGIALNQDLLSIISITNSSFIDCKMISNSSNLTYGWGGAIFIQTSVSAENLNETNFQLRDLIFTGCSAVNSIGNNIHICSTNTYNTGIAIVTRSLLTVKDTPNLYTSSEYTYDYMGIDESQVNYGEGPNSDHKTLFLAAQQGYISKQYYIRSFNTIYLNINNEGLVSISNSSFSQCEAYYGGGINAFINSGGKLSIQQQCNFTQYKASYGGGGIYAQISGVNSLLSLEDGVKFESCISTYGGGIYFFVDGGGQININNQCLFVECKSISGSGGGIYSYLYEGTFKIDGATFDRCTCSQPGNGGGIALIHKPSSKLSITNSSFIDCKTISNSSNQRYGWGGAIFIQTSIIAQNLNESNFLMRDLTFSGCSAVNSTGNNLHIQSINTHATGEAIKNGSLLTVKDIPDLYENKINGAYYMGIDESDVDDGNAPISKHEPLFNIPQSRIFLNPYYINSNDGIDNVFCGESDMP
ncbi:MAG: hypothetical protein EZS28_030490, partial [Streblomastix strix]